LSGSRQPSGDYLDLGQINRSIVQEYGMRKAGPVHFTEATYGPSHKSRAVGKWQKLETTKSNRH